VNRPTETPRRLLFVMDPYASLNLATETSLLLMQELIDRGHAVDWIELDAITLDGDRLRLSTRRVEQVAPLVLGAAVDSDGHAFDAALIRKDPPFDGNYLHLTQLLDRLPATVLQVNPARALRAFNEKLVAMRFERFMPPTIVSMAADALATFVRAHGRAVLKPLDDCSGRGITFVDAHDPALDALIATHLRDAGGKPRFLQAQAFLPAIAAGDKRVYLVDGEVAGIVNRVPAEGSLLGNIHQGASVHAAGLSDAEIECIDALRPFLREHGLLLVGADFIGAKLTELNITSPSAVRQINAVSGERLERRLVDAILAAIERHRCCPDRALPAMFGRRARRFERGGWPRLAGLRCC
jgi:glutathione synthase